MNTDAKYRFERGIDPNSIVEGLELGAQLISQICGGQASKFTVSGKNLQKGKSIKFEIDKFENLIGITMSINEAQKNFFISWI